MSAGKPETKTVQVPVQVIIQIQQQTLQGVVALVLSGSFERADLVPAVMRRIFADAIVTAANNPVMESALCEECSGVRADHPLSEDGFRYCKAADGEAPGSPKRFKPGRPRVALVGPDGAVQ